MPEQHTRRRPIAYVTFTIADQTPLTPDVVRRMLNKIPGFSDIVEMSVSDIQEPIGVRRAAIYYTTSMPWEDQ